MSWNPLQARRERLARAAEAAERAAELDRMERAEQRQMFQATILAMTAMVEKAFEASTAQQGAFKAWMDSFASGGTPQVRQWDDAADLERYLASRDDAALPTELKGLDKMTQFELLLDKLDS